MLVIIFFVLLVVYVWLRWRRIKMEPPVLPEYWPIIGHAPLIVNEDRIWDLVELMSSRSLEVGGTATIYLGPKTVYVITDPDDALTASNACLAKSDFYGFAKDWLGNGLVTSDVSTWKVHRKLLCPAFSQKLLDSFTSIFNKQARKLVDSMACEMGRGEFDHWPYLALNGLETICLTGFGTHVQEEDEKIHKAYSVAIQDMFLVIIERVSKIWLHNPRVYKWTQLKRREAESIKVLHNMTDTILQRRKSEMNNNNNEIEKDGKVKPFLDLMLELANEKGVLTDQDVRNQVDTMIVAGHDTSANTLLFTLTLLGSHPDIQEKVFKEIQSLQIDENSDVYKYDLMKLVYTEAVLKETLRLYPILPIITRNVDRCVKLKNHTMFPGNYVFIAVNGLHRNQVWGPDAHDFRPERWLQPDTLTKSTGAYAGFSIGKRFCLGKNYALTSMKISLVHLLRRYKITSDCSRLKLRLGVMLKPVSGHHISIEPRNI